MSPFRHLAVPARFRRLAVAAWVPPNLTLGAWLAHEPLGQAAIAVRDVAPLVGQFAVIEAKVLRLKWEGRI